MFEFHKDKERYFDIQYKTSKDHIIPFLKENGIDVHGRHVLEIGCAEAGVLKGFLEEDCHCVGIELSPARIELAKEFFRHNAKADRLNLISENIYDINPVEKFESLFDIILLKDVIEHIHDHPRFFSEIHSFLKSDGIIFFGFPPWQMPFGGHQQIARSKVLSKWIYVHLLPKFLYKAIMNLFGESEQTQIELLEIAETGLSIEEFERHAKTAGFQIRQRKLWLTNPIYHYKFGLKIRAQLPIVRSIPYLRNFLTTCAYFVISKSET